MRAVTFSHPKVAEKVNDRFVPVWYNRGTGFHNCEFWTEKRIFANDGDCYPTKNICTFFLTPDRKVAYYVAGYYAPDVFLDILETVDGMQSARTDAQRKAVHLKASATILARIHEVQGAMKADKSTGIERVKELAGHSDFQYGPDRHDHSLNCLREIKQSLSYRRTVHDSLARAGFVPLKTVQHDYKYGNSFTEEPREGSDVPTGVARPQIPGLTANTKTEP